MNNNPKQCLVHTQLQINEFRTVQFKLGENIFLISYWLDTRLGPWQLNPIQKLYFKKSTALFLFLNKMYIFAKTYIIQKLYRVQEIEIFA